LSAYGRATVAPLASSPPWRRHLKRPISACGIAGVNVGHGWLLPVARQGGWCGWLAGRRLPSPRGGGQNYAGSQGMSHGCRLGLLAADHGGWCCLAIANAVWDCVGGRRLQQRHHGKTRFVVDCGGLVRLARQLRRITSSEDGAYDNLACWHDDGGCVCRWCATSCCRPTGAGRLF
jgi:hypothetical protein